MAPNERVRDNSVEKSTSYTAIKEAQAFELENISDNAVQNATPEIWPHTLITEFETTFGKKAKIYRTNEFQKFPLTKLAALAFHGTTLLFFQGLAVALFLCWLCPAWLSIPAMCIYVAHVFMCTAQHTGSMEWRWYRRSAMAFAGFEYFNFAMSIEDDTKLQSGKTYIFGVHPHGIYGFGQVLWMSTRETNPFYRLFPFMVNRLSSSRWHFHFLRYPQNMLSFAVELCPEPSEPNPSSQLTF